MCVSVCGCGCAWGGQWGGKGEETLYTVGVSATFTNAWRMVVDTGACTSTLC